MKPLYVLIQDNGDFARTGGSSTPVRVKIYETIEKAEKQAKILKNVRVVKYEAR
jgi:hypothetical protein